MEIESRLRELHHALARGEAPARWMVERDAINELRRKLLEMRSEQAKGSEPSLRR